MLKTRRTLESFKATAAATNAKDQLRAIVGGTTTECHKILG
jgi:hypothetical protein